MNDSKPQDNTPQHVKEFMKDIENLEDDSDFNHWNTKLKLLFRLNQIGWILSNKVTVK